MDLIKRYQGIAFLITAFFLLCLLHPTYFMADDWERLYAYYTQNSENFLRHYYLRFFIQGLSSEYLFPSLFLPFSTSPLFSLLLGKIILWGSLVGAAYFYLTAFSFPSIPSLKERIITSPWWGILPLIIAFNPNNHEWNFFPTVMTLTPILLLMGIVFNLTHRGPLSKGKILLNTVSILIGFYSYESLLPFSILMEISFFFYGCPDTRELGFFQNARRIMVFTIPAIFCAVLLKYVSYRHQISVNGHIQPYAAEPGLHQYLFKQFLNLSFGHDYFKIRWASGIAAMIGFFLLLIARIKTTTWKTFFTKDLVLLICYFVGSSYYFLIMNYSARRALGGPLYFIWGFLFMGLFLLIQSPHLSRAWKRSLQFFVIVPFLFHHGFIMKEKSFERKNYFQKMQALREEIRQRPQEADPLVVEREQIVGNLKRGWHLVNPIQLHGLLRHHLGPEDYRQVLPFAKQFPHYRFIYEIK